MPFVNLTPHPIHLHFDDGHVLTVMSTGLARCVQTDSVVGNVHGINLVKPKYGDITGLPDPDGSIFIVSALVASAAKRHDVVSPGDLVRDYTGRIVGCKSLLSYV